MKKVSLLALASWFIVSSVHATLVRETFATDPALDGWQVFGDTNLFQWDSTNQVLDVTWDSSQTNSFFYHPLGAVYTKTKDFVITFDLQLNDVAIGTTPGESLTFELGIGLINTANATSGNFYRGTGYFPDLVEFDYFPNDIYDDGAVSTFMISSQGNFSGGGFNDLLQLDTNTLYQVTMVYRSASQVLHTTMTAHGHPFVPIQDAYLPAGFDDFQVDAISINSYNDGEQDPDWAGSILAHGTVRNLAFASPPPIGLIQTPGPGHLQFASDTNWVYTVEESPDLVNWTAATTGLFGNGTNLLWQDSKVSTGASFYRVRADLP